MLALDSRENWCRLRTIVVLGERAGPGGEREEERANWRKLYGQMFSAGVDPPLQQDPGFPQRELACHVIGLHTRFGPGVFFFGPSPSRPVKQPTDGSVGRVYIFKIELVATSSVTGSALRKSQLCCYFWDFGAPRNHIDMM